MSDGPSDFESGYFFESQKRIQDRRSALGIDQGTTRSSSSVSEGSGSGGGSFLGAIVWAVVVALGYAAYYAVIFGAWLIWELTKAISSAIFGRR